MLELIETGRGFHYPLKEDLVGYWRMEESFWSGTPGEVKDLSGQDNHGTMQGGGTLDSIAGKLGQGFGGNAKNYISLPPAAFPQQSGSLFMWVMSKASLPSNMRFVSTDDSGGVNFEARTYFNGVSSMLLVVMPSETGATKNVYLPSVFAGDTWAHIGWTWSYSAGSDKTTITGHLNTVPGNPVELDGKLNIPDLSFDLAHWRGGPLPAGAAIDEVTLYDIMVDSGEIADLYNSGAAMILSLYGSFKLPPQVEGIRLKQLVDTRSEMEVVEV